jgi:transposase InsO family protein
LDRLAEAAPGLRRDGAPECWDNAVAESFFATIKTELIHRHTWPTRKAATSAIFDYIEGWYNTRRHSTLAYLSPRQYESSITVTRRAGSLTTSHRPCPSKRVNPRAAYYLREPCRG